jgi:hypothetical protein
MLQRNRCYWPTSGISVTKEISYGQDHRAQIQRPQLCRKKLFGYLWLFRLYGFLVYHILLWVRGGAIG